MRFSGSVEGRKPFAFLIGLALLGGVLLWQLTEPDRPSRSPVQRVGNAQVEGAAPAPLLEVSVPPERDIPSARIEPTGRLVVQLIAPQGGELCVVVRDASGTRVASLELSPSSPRAQLDCPPGEYRLAVATEGSTGLDPLEQRVVLSAGSTESVEFRLPTLGRLFGRLTDEHGLGVEGVTVTLEGLDQSAVCEARTRADGGFTFPPLPVGTYGLVVGDPLGPILPLRVFLLEDGLGEQEIRVPALLELEVRVLDEMGLVVPEAEVEGVGEQGGRVAGVTDQEGKLRATLLPPGNYRIFARHPSLGRGNRIFVLSAESSKAIEIQLLTGPPPR